VVAGGAEADAVRGAASRARRNRLGRQGSGDCGMWRAHNGDENVACDGSALDEKVVPGLLDELFFLR
jgi:hypothetical protein